MRRKELVLRPVTLVLTLLAIPAFGADYDPQLGQKIEAYLSPKSTQLPEGKGYHRAIIGCDAAIAPNESCPNGAGKLTKCHVKGCPPFPDPRTPSNLDRFIGLGAEFFKWGAQFDVDPRLILAISFEESIFGTYWIDCDPLKQLFNAWNYFYTKTKCNQQDYKPSPFHSYQEGIGLLAAYLRTQYLDEGWGLKGNNLIAQIGTKYKLGLKIPGTKKLRSPGDPVPSTAAAWAKAVTTIYEELGGNVSDLSFHPSSGGGGGGSGGGGTGPFTISASLQGTGSGSIVSSPPGINCGATCSASFPAGTKLTLTANLGPQIGVNYFFEGWTGGCSGRVNPCVVTINSDLQVTATILKDNVTVLDSSCVGGLPSGTFSATGPVASILWGFGRNTQAPTLTCGSWSGPNSLGQCSRAPENPPMTQVTAIGLPGTTAVGLELIIGSSIFGEALTPVVCP